MALTKDQKAVLMDQYKEWIEGASNVVLLEQKGVPVNAINEVRKEMDATGGQMLVVKKRLFLQSSDKAGCEKGEIGTLDGHLTVLFAKEDEYAPLKLVYKMNKLFKKQKAEYEFSYLGGWYDKIWKDANFVEEMASLPSKEELVGKLLFLMKYPMQSMAAVLNQIQEKIADGQEVETKESDSAKEEVAPKEEAPKEESAEEVKEEVKAEEKGADAQTDEQKAPEAATE